MSDPYIVTEISSVRRQVIKMYHPTRGVEGCIVRHGTPPAVKHCLTEPGIRDHLMAAARQEEGGKLVE